jgi:RNA polymerase sigma-70 factor (ECF subfamily)
MVHPSPHLPDLLDDQVVERALQFDDERREEALTELARRYRDDILTAIGHTVHSVDVAEELAQDTFIKAFDNLSTYKLGSSFNKWLFAIASNTTVDYLRKKHVETVPLNEVMDEITPPDGVGRAIQLAIDSDPSSPISLDLKEHIPAIEQALARLRERERKIVIMRDIDALSNDHTAEVLDIPTGTVKSSLNRAHKKLRADLGGLWDSLRPLMAKYRALVRKRRS